MDRCASNLQISSQAIKFRTFLSYFLPRKAINGMEGCAGCTRVTSKKNGRISANGPLEQVPHGAYLIDNKHVKKRTCTFIALNRITSTAYNLLPNPY